MGWVSYGDYYIIVQNKVREQSAVLLTVNILTGTGTSHPVATGLPENPPRLIAPSATEGLESIFSEY